VSSSLYTLGRWAARARRLVVLAWLGVLVVVGAAVGLTQQGLDDSVSIPGTESQAALDRLAATFPQISGASAQVVVVAPDGTTVQDPGVRAPVEEAVGTLGAVDGVAAAVSPFDEALAAGAIADGGTAALVAVQMDVGGSEVTDAQKDALADVVADLEAALPDGAQAALGGELFTAEFPEPHLAELVGVGVALVVLLVTLGSFVAAGMPLANAFVGVGLSLLLVLGATAFAPITSTTPMLALMLGLAVGIDYALFVVARHQDQLRQGLDVEESIGRATATAGSAVVFAGLTVMIALLGLGVAGIPFLTTMGVAAAVAVGMAVLVSLTLLPAMLGAAGERLRRTRSPRRARRPGAAAGLAAESRSTAFYRGWVRTVTRRPLLTVVAVLAGVGALAAPALGLRLALPDAGNLPQDSSARITYDLVSEHFGEGFNGPLVVTGSIVTSTDPLGLMADLAAEVEALDGVAAVPLATPNETADTGIIQVVPEGAPASAQTEALVQEIRALAPALAEEYGVDLAVTGFTAVGIDVSDKLGEALLPFAVVVVGLSLVLLTMVFRSIAVPLKATLGYLLSVGAAFGVVALVFEQGVGADLLQVARTGPVISFMPIVVMGVLFGLAMDYQVFLVSRIREDYVHSGDARGSIETGFVASAKVVTAAAAIMVAVFVAFVPEGDSNIKPIALALAVGVFVDAFVVRMTLVPAVLELLGEKAWWMPRWLDRRLPSFDVEGEGLTKELQLAEWPEPGARDLVAAAGLTLVDPQDPARHVYADVSVRVPEGTSLVVRGVAGDGGSAAAEEAVSALLLTLAGRLAPDAGLLTVTGLVLPVRAGTVRSRVAVVHLPSTGADGVARALAERPALLVVDGADHAPPAVREAAAALLGRDGAPPVAVGTVSGHGAAVLPPPTDAVVVDVSGAAERAAEAVAAR
jgi:RND superfamily putative drug exporter